MKEIYLGDWKELGKEQLLKDFEIEPKILEGAEILLAYYEYVDYSGDAFVFIKRDNKLFEINGSHCSCFGLEGQWEEEETTIEALKYRLKKGLFGIDGDFGNELKKIIKRLQ
jgi:hypothetical protein